MLVDLQNIDLTGNDPNFSRSMRFVVFKGSQVINFREPVFADTIEVGKVSGVEIKILTHNVDYTIPTDTPEYVDYTAMSDAKVRASLNGDSFDRNLVSAIIMSANFSEEYQIVVSAHALYRRYSDFTDLGGGPEYTRSLGASIIERLNHLEVATNPLTHVTTGDIGKVAPLDEDLTAKAEENYIVGEIHKVNVPNDIYVIRPLYGDFYDDADLSVSFTGVEQQFINRTFVGKTIVVNEVNIVLTDSNIVKYLDTVQDVLVPTKKLVRNEDYIVRGIERAKTRIALVPSGVYSTIILTKKFTGDCSINYHAFGGSVTIQDIYTIKDTLTNLMMSISGSSYITVDQLNKLPKIVNMIDRIEKIEDTLHIHRPIAIPYEYAFEDGNSTEYWVDVATMFQGGFSDDGNIPNIYTETFRLVNDSLNYDAMFDLTYNLSLGTLEISNTRISACKFATVGMKYFEDRRTPMFRVVYDKLDVESGLILQMSISSDTPGSNLWQIHLCHYEEAMWSIIDKDGAYRDETTNSTILPNGDIWNTSISNMVSTNRVTLSDPYTIFVGSIDMNLIDSLSYRKGNVYDNVEDGTDLTDEPGQVELNGLIINPLSNDLVLVPSDIYGFKFTVYDRYEGKYIIKSSNTSKGTSVSAFGEVVYFDLDMCQISACVKMVNGEPKLYVKSHTGTNSLESNRFDLRQIDVLFDRRDV